MYGFRLDVTENLKKKFGTKQGKKKREIGWHGQY
jgi:hypothetical protein